MSLSLYLKCLLPPEKKKKKDEGKISLMKHLLCLRLYQIAMYLFNRTRVDGAEATCKSEKGVQRGVGEANKQSRYT